MSLTIDTVQVFILLGLGFLLTLLMIFAYELPQLKSLKTNIFFWSKCAQAVAWFSLIFRGENVDYVGIVMANSLLFISFTYEVIALRELITPLHRKTKQHYFIFLALSIIGFNVIYFFNNVESIRIVYYAIVNSVIYLSAMHLLIGKGRTLLMRFVGSVYMLFTVVTLYRGFLAFSTNSTSGSLFNPHEFQILFLLSIFLFFSFGSIGYIMLQKEKMDVALHHFASFDDLTGTLNRRTFTERANERLALFAKKQQTVSYMLFDIDHFKGINDTYGHHIGDLVLQDLAMKVKCQLDDEDVFGRYGGDEFGILLPGQNAAQSTQIAESIVLSLNNPLSAELPVAYTISVGVVTITPNSDTQLDMLYTSCDKALYEAKHNGRNGIARSELHVPCNIT